MRPTPDLWYGFIFFSPFSRWPSLPEMELQHPSCGVTCRKKVRWKPRSIGVVANHTINFLAVRGGPIFENPSSSPGASYTQISPTKTFTKDN